MSEKLKEILIGKNGSSKFCAYGDDSACGESLVFAMAVVERSKVNDAKSIIDHIKTKYRIPISKPLHCRTLFSGQKRQKEGLAHMDIDDVHSCFHDVLHQMKLLRVLCRFAHVARPLTETLTDKDEDFPLTILSGDKVIQGILAQACIHMGPGYPQADDIECWYSEDKTMTVFTKEGPRRQAQKGYEGFSDINAPVGSHHKLEPHVVRSSDEPLLQVADIYAYLASNALEEKRLSKPGFFHNSLHSIFWSAAPMSFDLSKLPQNRASS